MGSQETTASLASGEADEEARIEDSRFKTDGKHTDETKDTTGNAVKLDIKETGKKVNKSMMKKTIKKEPEIEIDSDGTFKPKLKKSETVKRRIEETKLEEIQLKHHAFENVPQTPSDEAVTNVQMYKPISIQTDKTNDEKTNKKKCTK